jgi:hypothetical protein
VLVTSGWFAAGAAACALFDAGVGDAGAADALPVERFVDADYAMAARAEDLVETLIDSAC